jgi:serine/threonine protein kinase
VTRLGSGGTADVFSAVTAAGTPVVVKLFRSADRTVEVCRREFRLSYAVGTDCTPATLGYGVSPAGAYLVHAHLPGYRPATTLTGVLTPPTLRRFGAALADTLATVHAHGVVHCDVKPSNLLVRGDDVRVINFGIARYTGQQCGAGGFVECSRGWAAPEQLRNAAATPALDVFAWGCVMAYLAGGVHPFASGSDEEWILRLQSADPDLRHLPQDLEPTVRAALARDPGNRPTTRQLVAACR